MRFYEIPVVSDRRQHADVRRDMHFESGIGCQIQAGTRLYVIRPQWPIDAGPEIHERRKSLVHEEVVSAEEKRNGRELIAIEMSVPHSDASTELLID